LDLGNHSYVVAYGGRHGDPPKLLTKPGGGGAASDAVFPSCVYVTSQADGEVVMHTERPLSEEDGTIVEFPLAKQLLGRTKTQDLAPEVVEMCRNCGVVPSAAAATEEEDAELSLFIRDEFLPQEVRDFLNRRRGDDDDDDSRSRPSFTASDVVKFLLESIMRALRDEEGFGDVGTAVVTVPVLASDFVIDRYRQLVSETWGAERVLVVREPVAACLHYFSTLPAVRTEEERVMMVIDMGHGTTDFALVKKQRGGGGSPDRATQVSKYHGTYSVSGSTLTQELTEYVTNRLYEAVNRCREKLCRKYPSLRLTQVQTWKISSEDVDRLKRVLSKYQQDNPHKRGTLLPLTALRAVDKEAKKANELSRQVILDCVGSNKSVADECMFPTRIDIDAFTAVLSNSTFKRRLRNLVTDFVKDVEGGYNVLLVGATTKLPVVREVVEAQTGVSTTQMSMGNPETKVALGAWLYEPAAAAEEEAADAGLISVRDDRTTTSYGILLLRGSRMICCRYIAPNEQLPQLQRKNPRTMYSNDVREDEQGRRTMRVDVIQGNFVDGQARDTARLDNFTWSVYVPVERDAPVQGQPFELSMSLSADHTLEVTARVADSPEIRETKRPRVGASE